MKITTIVSSNSLKQNTYILSTNNTTIMIDCGATLESAQAEFMKDTGKRLSKIDAIFLTHTHFDHTLALSEFDNEYKNPTIFVKKGAKNLISDPYHNASGMLGNPLTYQPKNIVEIEDEKEIKIFDISIKPIFTEGHTDCSMCFIVNNFLFTGDTEFYLAIGRTDMPTGNPDKLLQSLKKLKSIKSILRYPGHGIPYKKNS